MTVLALAARLSRVLGVDVARLRDGLLVSNLRSADICLDIVFPEQSVNDDLKMELAHAGNDCLACLLIRMSPECRILLSQLRERFAKLALAGLCLGLDSQLYNRLREFHALQNDRMCIVTDRIACSRELESDRRGYIAAVDLLKLISLIRVHLKDAANALLLILSSIQDV